jgi:hypothetical protein
MTIVGISTLHWKLCLMVSTSSMSWFSAWCLFRHMDKSLTMA